MSEKALLNLANQKAKADAAASALQKKRARASKLISSQLPSSNSNSNLNQQTRKKRRNSLNLSDDPSSAITTEAVASYPSTDSIALSVHGMLTDLSNISCSHIVGDSVHYEALLQAVRAVFPYDCTRISSSTNKLSIVKLAQLTLFHEDAAGIVVNDMLQYIQALRDQGSPIALSSSSSSSSTTVPFALTSRSEELSELTTMLENWIEQSRYETARIIWSFLCGGNARIKRALLRAKVTSPRFLSLWKVAPQSLFDVLLQADKNIVNVKIVNHWNRALLNDLISNTASPASDDLLSSSASISKSISNKKSKSNNDGIFDPPIQTYLPFNLTYVQSMCMISDCLLHDPNFAMSWLNDIVDTYTDEEDDSSIIAKEDTELNELKKMKSSILLQSGAESNLGKPQKSAADLSVGDESATKRIVDEEHFGPAEPIPPPKQHNRRPLKRNFSYSSLDDFADVSDGMVSPGQLFVKSRLSISTPAPDATGSNVQNEDCSSGRSESDPLVETESEEWLYESAAHAFIGCRVRVPIESVIPLNSGDFDRGEGLNPCGSSSDSSEESMATHSLIQRYDWFEDGTIIGYLPPTESEPMALWRVRLDGLLSDASKILVVQSSHAMTVKQTTSTRESGCSNETQSLSIRVRMKAGEDTIPTTQLPAAVEDFLRVEDLEESECIAAMSVAYKSYCNNN